MEAHNDWARIQIAVCRSEDDGTTFSETYYPTVLFEKMGAENGSWNNPVLIADKEMVHLIFHQNYEWALQTDRYGMTRTDQEE